MHETCYNANEFLDCLIPSLTWSMQLFMVRLNLLHESYLFGVTTV
jgi:hypothetical protein